MRGLLFPVHPSALTVLSGQLDLTNRATFERYFGDRRADAFLCEHVWEHMTLEQGRAAAQRYFDFLNPGGFLRCAVPDAMVQATQTPFQDEACQAFCGRLEQLLYRELRARRLKFRVNSC
ncbi:hypothetical protein [Deinococcus sp. QL22]|uniref:hypothetical protein n=1 Tax=Deinococcus sp. QL22 TaxID=2939437 RepID=UPI00353021E9